MVTINGCHDYTPLFWLKSELKLLPFILKCIWVKNWINLTTKKFFIILPPSWQTCISIFKKPPLSVPLQCPPFVLFTEENFPLHVAVGEEKKS